MSPYRKARASNRRTQRADAGVKDGARRVEQILAEERRRTRRGQNAARKGGPKG